MASYLVQEADGTSQFLLEDSSGSLLLEISVAVTPPAETPSDVGGALFHHPPPRRKRRRVHLEAAVATVRVTAYAPKVTIGTVVVLPSIRATAHAAAPQFTLTARASVAHTIYRATPDHRTRQLNQELAQLTEEILLIT